MINSLLAKGFTFFAQVLVKIQPIWDKYKALIGLIVGILIGWFVLGWGLFPIEWTNATPGHLRADFKSAYLAYTAREHFDDTSDVSLLRSRLGLDLPKSQNVPWLENRENLLKDIETALENAEQFNLQNYTQSLERLQSFANEQTELLFEGPPSAEGPGEQPAEEGAPFSRLLRIVGIIIVILLVGAAIFAIWSILATRRGEQETADTAQAGTGTQTVGEYEVETTEAPVKSFSTPYVLGDDYFDPSFSIEIGNDFLGECGIGISETIGAGDPKRVTAFEAWLFDKSDIRTETKVLASHYAFEDADLMSKLEPKGKEVLELESGKEIILETTSLRVKAKVKDLEYAESNELPPRSFIQKVNFELQAWVKQVEDPGFPDYQDYETE
jgi:hypothetical protein